MRLNLLNILTALFVACVVAGTGVLVSIWAVPQWEAYQAETTVARMEASASSGASSSAAGSAQLSEARSYNAALAGESSGSATPYENQLNLVDPRAIGWLDIPSIRLKRAVYHYDNEDVLMVGLGHIEGTSLPVGGESTHCCVTGHSGMPGAYMFDNLGAMEVGDVFVFWTLGDPYAYKVYDIEVVNPDDTSGLTIQKGRDLATLITCTPYGINSHRLLVHGERTDYVPELMAGADPHPTSDRLWVLGLGIIAAAGLAGLGLYALLGGSTLKLASISGLNERIVWRRGAGGPSPRGMGHGAAQDGAPAQGELRMELKPFGRTRLTVSGEPVAARWHREGAGYVIDLLDGGFDDLVPTESGRIADVRLPDRLHIQRVEGEWVASVEVDGKPGTLTFEG